MFCTIKTIGTPTGDFLVEKGTTEVFVKSEKQKNTNPSSLGFEYPFIKRLGFFKVLEVYA